jgi:capsular exopolysaccharide synthesis family protein
LSKFSKALEQAERDRALRALSPRPSAVSPASPPTPSPPIPTSGREASTSPDGIDDHLVSLLTPNAVEAEQYRGLRHVVEQAHKRSGLSVVAITSPTLGDGKTTTAINLAGALAQAQGVRVLLIDADLRRPAVARRLGLVEADGPALGDLVLDPSVSFDAVVRSRPPFNLAVIPAGSASPNSYELFQSPRMGEILAEARRRFDYVVLDTPPLVPVLDSRVLGRWVDSYLIVVRCHQTSRRLLADALNVVEPDKVVGLLFNNSERPTATSSYYDYAYSSLRRGRKTGPLSRIGRGRGTPEISTM